ncbi:hypothetical protein N8T08_004200, partial [Aspergillus melleus]
VGAQCCPGRPVLGHLRQPASARRGDGLVHVRHDVPASTGTYYLGFRVDRLVEVDFLGRTHHRRRGISAPGHHAGDVHACVNSAIREVSAARRGEIVGVGGVPCADARVLAEDGLGAEPAVRYDHARAHRVLLLVVSCPDLLHLIPVLSGISDCVPAYVPPPSHIKLANGS